jgi:GAF domain-containing protein
LTRALIGPHRAPLPDPGRTLAKRSIDFSHQQLTLCGENGHTMVAQVQHNEAKRLKVLWQYDVLDTVPEAMFDDLTELAARICEAPIALISLVDEDRQWFKSRVGVSVKETSRDISFCSYAIQQEGLFIIPDTTKDRRFAQNPLVLSDPKIRFYAGAPLITPDGHALGTLCVIDKVPRSLRPEQQQALRVLARHVMTQLELRRHARELVEARQEGANVKDELARLRTEVELLRRKLAAGKSQSSRAPRNARQNSRR